MYVKTLLHCEFTVNADLLSGKMSDVLWVGDYLSSRQI